jgi:hypothetical protein
MTSEVRMVRRYTNTRCARVKMPQAEKSRTRIETTALEFPTVSKLPVRELCGRCGPRVLNLASLILHVAEDGRGAAHLVGHSISEQKVGNARTLAMWTR